MNKLFDKFTNSYIGLTILVIGSILVGATILIFPERVPLSITIAGIHYFLLAFMFGKAIYYKYQSNRINVINDTVMYDGELINLNEAKEDIEHSFLLSLKANGIELPNDVVCNVHENKIVLSCGTVIELYDYDDYNVADRGRIIITANLLNDSDLSIVTAILNNLGTAFFSAHYSCGIYSALINGKL